jgi:hypothetical protein
MKHAPRAIAITTLLSLSLGSVAIFGALVPAAVHADNDVARRTCQDGGWLVTSFAQFQSRHTPGDDSGELDEVKALVAKRTAADVDAIRRWNVGGPAYRWNQLAVEEMLGAFVATLRRDRRWPTVSNNVSPSITLAATWNMRSSVL